MRLSIERNTEAVAPASAAVAADPAAPDLSFLARDAGQALQSFFTTIDRITADNPVDLAGRDPQALRIQAMRQGRAVGAGIGFFLKLRPYAALDEIRRRGKLFQPPFGPLLVAEGAAVRDVLERDQEFTVEPYGVEMMKVMSPQYNGGFSTFILSTDDNPLYEPDKRLLSALCNRSDAEAITGIVHEDCVRRLRAAVTSAVTNGSQTIDVVQALARYVPVTLGHRYLGVPVAAQEGSFELTPEMLTYYGAPI
jgi:hypothetical protein